MRLIDEALCEEHCENAVNPPPKHGCSTHLFAAFTNLSNLTKKSSNSQKARFHMSRPETIFLPYHKEEP
jgi:hypothetical protein